MSLLPIHLGISDHCTVPHRGEYLSKKSETVYPPICGILKLSVQLNQKIVKLPIKIFKQSQNEDISFQAKLKNTTNSHPKFEKWGRSGGQPLWLWWGYRQSAWWKGWPILDLVLGLQGSGAEWGGSLRREEPGRRKPIARVIWTGVLAGRVGHLCPKLHNTSLYIRFHCQVCSVKAIK